MASYFHQFVKNVRSYVATWVCEKCENCSVKRKCCEEDMKIEGESAPPTKKANLEIQIHTDSCQCCGNVAEIEGTVPNTEDDENDDAEFVKSHEIDASPCRDGLHDPEFNDRIDYLRKTFLNPIRFPALYKSANIFPPKGMYFFGTGINERALETIKEFSTDLSEELGVERVPIFRTTHVDAYRNCEGAETSFVDKVFEAAVKFTPSIIFFPELDKFGTPHSTRRDEIVAKICYYMDALVAGEVFVFATVDATPPAPFNRLNGPPRFSTGYHVATAVLTSGVLAFLKTETEKWKISEENNSRDEILAKVSEILSSYPDPIKHFDLTTLCQEMYHTIMQEALNSAGKHACDCCTCPPPPPKFPSLPQWEAGIKAHIKPTEATKAVAAVAAPAAQPQTEKWDEFKVEEDLSLKKMAGTGKTLLGKTLAAELSRLDDGKGKFAFFYHKGTECYSKYVGETEAKLRAIFANAEAKKPAIIFMDEIDGICRVRDESASKFYTGVVTTILGLMDNLPRGEVFVIAATNRLTSLDPALRRPGRFDKCVEFQAPKFAGRKAILQIHTATWDAKSKMEDNFADEIAQMTGGYTGADLEQVCRQAFTLAMRRHSQNAPEENVPPVDFDGLIVQKQDWYGSLKSVRPNGTNYFGNAVITDKPILAGAAAALKGKVDEITKRLAYFLNKSEQSGSLDMDSKSGGVLNSFLIWGSDAKQLKVIEHLLIPALLSSSEFSSVVAAKFEIPPLGVGTEVVERRISATFAQVLNPGEDKLGVLYVPGIDHLLNTRIGKFSEMKEHDQILDSFEILRGEKVLLLGTATGSPDQMSDRVQGLFRAPNATEIRLVFSQISAKIPTTPFEKIMTKLGCSTEGGNKFKARKNLTLYDLLDFEGEITQISAQFDLKSDQEEKSEEFYVALNNATNAFCSYLDGREKYKSALSTMYT
ncbi:ATPase family AAA domain-containing protein 2B [Folsomia candida]|uniref:ATPase family AAA domain-containing protein 2B n=1 Tax=Folsomia candida TaxID=158441 RepID=A0A226D751_FOLCA|nr:ATPase family AAA domain-containing protein 2B [Folsomia candida]